MVGLFKHQLFFSKKRSHDFIALDPTQTVGLQKSGSDYSWLVGGFKHEFYVPFHLWVFHHPNYI
jgi:hypothetical protein